MNDYPEIPLKQPLIIALLSAFALNAPAIAHSQTTACLNPTQVKTLEASMASVLTAKAAALKPYQAQETALVAKVAQATTAYESATQSFNSTVSSLEAMKKRMADIEALLRTPTGEAAEALSAIKAKTAERDQLQRDYTFLKAQLAERQSALTQAIAGLQERKLPIQQRVQAVTQRLKTLSQPAADGSTSVRGTLGYFEKLQAYHRNVAEFQYPLGLANHELARIDLEIQQVKTNAARDRLAIEVKLGLVGNTLTAANATLTSLQKLKTTLDNRTGLVTEAAKLKLAYEAGIAKLPTLQSTVLAARNALNSATTSLKALRASMEKVTLTYDQRYATLKRQLAIPRCPTITTK